MSDNQHDTSGVAPTHGVPSFSRRSFMKTSAAAGAGAVALGGASPASAQQRSNCEGEFAAFEDLGDGHFTMLNNDWGNPDADQCIYEYSDGSVGWDFCCGTSDINYPEVYCGTRPWGGDTGVPEYQGLTIGEVDDLVMEYDVDINIDGTWNLAPEFWLLDGEPQQEDPPLTHEIMLVLDHADSHSHGGTRRDRAFSDDFGNEYDYWAFYNEGGTSADFHIFRLSNPSSCGTVDWTAIIDFLYQEGQIRDSLTTTGIELGTEYWDSASGDVRVNTFNVNINGGIYRLGTESACSGQGVGGGGGGSEPDAPGDVWTESVGTDSASVGWSSVADANEYDVYLDGAYQETTSGTSASFSGLSDGTSYTAGVEAVNDYGNSSRATATFTTETESGGGACEGLDTETVDGQTVCDVENDGLYRDVNGDGDLGQDDVVHFFENQHRDAWDRPQLFDFSQNGSIGHGDVVALFEDVVL